MATSVTLLIAYPKEIIRAGLRAMLAGTSVQIVGEAADAPGTLALASKLRPAVVLLDAGIPGGDAFDLVRTLSKTLSGTRCVLLSALDNPTYMARARAVGAANFLLKDISRSDLVKAIEGAAAGKPASGGGPFIKIAAALDTSDARPSRAPGLTRRESQVLSHLAFGLSNDEIASSLGISVETVKEHVQNLLRKLAVHDRTQAAVWAVQSGVV